MKQIFLAAAAIVCAICVPGQASAQTDEIQVYDGDLSPVGTFNLTWHNNYTPKGLTTPAFPGAIVADKSLNGVTEWAYGVTPWFEAGLYLPLYSHSTNLGGTFDGFKLRALFAVPHAAERKFFYGANFEFSINQKDWSESRYSSEVRPIIGWHLKPWDIIINPIIDTDYDGFKNLDFAPAMRIAYNFSDRWALAAEEYADYGKISSPFSTSDQSHMIFGVVNHTMRFLEIEAGVGFGLTSSTDNVTVKLLLIKDLN
jgi:opacity protein-like surface antigen